MACRAADSVGLTPYVDAMRAFIEHPNGLGEGMSNDEPVTTISIEGTWGSGKSTFIEHLADELAKDGVPVVHFRPWVYSESDDLWMAFASAFHDQVRKHLPRRIYVPRMIGLWLRRRFCWGPDRARLRWTRIVIWLALAATLVSLFVVGSIEDLHIDVPWTIVTSALGVAAILLRMIPSLIQLLRHGEAPRVPEVNRVEADFVELVQALCPKGGPASENPAWWSTRRHRRRALSRRAVVFIDDMDRCESMGVAETLRILSMLVNDRSNVFIVMAFDREQVAGLLAKERFELAPFLRHRQAEQNDENGEPVSDLSTGQQRELAIDHANEYLEKFIQVTFTLPRITDSSSLLRTSAEDRVTEAVLHGESIAALAETATDARDMAWQGAVASAIQSLALHPRQIAILRTDVYLRFLVLLRLGRLVRHTPRSFESRHVSLEQVALYEALLIVAPRLRSALRREWRLLHVLAAEAIYEDVDVRLEHRDCTSHNDDLRRRWQRRIDGHERRLGLQMAFEHGAQDTSNPRTPSASTIESIDVRVLLDFHEPTGAALELLDNAPDAEHVEVRDSRPAEPPRPDEPTVDEDADGTNLYYVADKRKWEARLREAIKEHGEDHLEVATCHNGLGIALLNLGDLPSAYDHVERALSIRLQTHGPDHSTVANSRSDLGLVLHDMGKLDQARTQHEQALLSRTSALGEDHPDVAISRSNLGIVLRDAGQFKDAEKQLRIALAVDIKTRGENHPDVAKSRNNLGNVLSDLGFLEAANEQYERALAVRIESIGEDHPDTAASRNNLGNMAYVRGELDLAREQHERALRIRIDAFGEGHPQVALSRSNLAIVLRDLGSLDEALAQVEQAISIRIETLGENHPDVATSRSNLGAVLADLGDLDGARDQHDHALAIRLDTLGEGHPDIATSRNNLGLVFCDMGALSEARNQHELAIKIYRASLGDDHRYIAAVRGYLARLDAREGMVEQAKETLADVIRRTADTMGPTARYPVIFGRTLRRLGGDPLAIIDDPAYAECLDGPWYPEWGEPPKNDG